MMGIIPPRPPLPRTATPEEMIADLARIRREIRRGRLVNLGLGCFAIVAALAFCVHVLAK